MPGLSPEQARRVYDRIGPLQDTQAFYERPAVADLIANADFEAARLVCEVGCGTGRVAADLLSRHLSTDCHYVGVDVSPRMVALATARLRPWGERATVHLSHGSTRLAVETGTCTHVLATYVLDLLDDATAAIMVGEAHRVLEPNGRLCLVSSTDGPRLFSHVVMNAWRWLGSVSPTLVGGCRPVALASYLPSGQWAIAYRNVVVRWGVASEVVVTRRRGG